MSRLTGHPGDTVIMSIGQLGRGKSLANQLDKTRVRCYGLEDSRAGGWVDGVPIFRSCVTTCCGVWDGVWEKGRGTRVFGSHRNAGGLLFIIHFTILDISSIASCLPVSCRGGARGMSCICSSKTLRPLSRATWDMRPSVCIRFMHCGPFLLLTCYLHLGPHLFLPEVIPLVVHS